jgi:hypothetical protein
MSSFCAVIKKSLKISDCTYKMKIDPNILFICYAFKYKFYFLDKSDINNFYKKAIKGFLIQSYLSVHYTISSVLPSIFLVLIIIF